MYLKSLFLQQFRNYKEGYFEFHPSLNVICGPNAQGKTNLLEAIHYLMFGRSFRSCVHQDLILNGSPSFYLEAIFCKHDVDQKLRLFSNLKERKMIYNSTTLPHLSNLLGLIQGVVMTPDDVNIIKGSPLLRRQFLDTQIAQTDPLYVHHLMRYTKAMRHRNQLLKQKILTSIESWEHEMAKASAYLIMQRKKATFRLHLHCQKFYSYLTEEKEELTLQYRSTSFHCQNAQEIQEFYLKEFEKNRKRELSLGMTWSGPHKDDISIAIDGKDTRFFASEGQQRSCVAALYMGQWERLKEESEEIPLFIIDDLAISLDERRKKQLMDQLLQLGQVFVTTTDQEFSHSFQNSKKVFLLAKSRSH